MKQQERKGMKEMYLLIVEKIRLGVVISDGLFPSLGDDEVEDDLEALSRCDILMRSGSTEDVLYYLVRYDGVIYSVEYDRLLERILFY